MTLRSRARCNCCQARRIKDLRADYRTMAPMMFDDKPPAFDGILAKIKTLQETINKT